MESPNENSHHDYNWPVLALLSVNILLNFVGLYTRKSEMDTRHAEIIAAIQARHSQK